MNTEEQHKKDMIGIRALYRYYDREFVRRYLGKITMPNHLKWVEKLNKDDLKKWIETRKET